jgi:predicted nucleic acid-binding protein
MTVYCDASAIVKLVVQDAESDALLAYLARDVTAVTSALCLTEVTRTLRRAPLSREEVGAALTGFYLIELTRTILNQAGWVATERVGSLGAIHLATALSLGISDLHFISYDDHIVDAAKAMRLRVVRPG